MRDKNKNGFQTKQKPVYKSLNGKNNMSFVESAYKDIVRSVGSIAHETGGILLGTTEDFIVRKKWTGWMGA